MSGEIMVDQSKRALLGLMAAGAAATVITPFSAHAAKAGPASKSLQFLNLHTGERFKATFWEKGRYVADALGGFNRILRDHRTNDVHPMDPQLFDLLHSLQKRVGHNGDIHIISGFRSDKSNEMLRNHGSGGVAKKSFHLQGKAIDIAMPGRELKDIYRTALSMRQGGVGLYTGSGFVHVDTGPVRTWGA